MTRDEAIENAMDLIFDRLKTKQIFVGQISDDGERIHVGTRYWTYDPPRRIPPKGTPVMYPAQKLLAFSMGELCECGRVEKGLLVSASHDGTKSVNQIFTNWIELVESTS